MWPTAAHHGQVTPKRITWVWGTSSGRSFWWRINRLQLRSEGVRKHVVSRFEFPKCLRYLVRTVGIRGKLCFVVKNIRQREFHLRAAYLQLKALPKLWPRFVCCDEMKTFLVKELVVVRKKNINQCLLILKSLQSLKLSFKFYWMFVRNVVLHMLFFGYQLTPHDHFTYQKFWNSTTQG